MRLPEPFKVLHTFTLQRERFVLKFTQLSTFSSARQTLFWVTTFPATLLATGIEDDPNHEGPLMNIPPHELIKMVKMMTMMVMMAMIMMMNEEGGQ